MNKMFAWPNILKAFFVRDFQIRTSYRLAFVLEVFGVFFSLSIFYFISRLVGPSANPYLEKYDSDYFTFALVGMAFAAYLNTSMKSFADRIREGQMSGVLEAMLATPADLKAILAGSSMWDFFFNSVRILIYFFVGWLVFDVTFPRADIGAALLVLALTITSFAAFGVLSAAFILIYKRGDPVHFLFGTLSGLMSGVFFPIEVLPGWLQPFSYLFPLTHALYAFRQTLTAGWSSAQLWPQILLLLIFTVILLPVSYKIFLRALKRARSEGSLSQY